MFSVAKHKQMKFSAVRFKISQRYVLMEIFSVHLYFECSFSNETNVESEPCYCL